MKALRLLAGALSVVAGSSGQSMAQDFPKKPIKIIVTADAGAARIPRRGGSPRIYRNTWA
ncbi:MAG TPA: hypothetical protein VGK94_10855 [Candidatus Polarisedimenticolia bacterium]|jgi:tripartite-type tricarboxylate transporter receptor subunit TctC